MFTNKEIIKVDSIDSKGNKTLIDITIDPASPEFRKDMQEVSYVTRSDQDTFFLARALNYAKQKIVMPIYPEYKFANGGLISLDGSVPVGADSSTYKESDGTGKMKPLAEDSDDYPLVEVKTQEKKNIYKDYAHGLRISYRDIERSAFLGDQIFNILDRKIQIIRRTADQQLDDLIAFGDKETGLVGFLNNPNVPNTAVAGATWANKSDQEIMDDIKKAVSSYRKDTRGISPNRMLLSVDSYDRLISSNLNSNFVSPLDRIQSLYPIRVEWVAQMENIFTGDSNGFVLYNDSSEFVQADIPLRLEARDIERKSLSWKQPYRLRAGSTLIYMPKTVSYNYGI
jgi:hypothetical protein